MSQISIRRAYTGRHVLLTGASGFLGKVWLVMMLDHIPEIERIYILIRPKARRPARKRFEKMVASSPAFKPLHEKFGPELGEFLARKVEVVEGDIGTPGLGIDPVVLPRLQRDIDLVINCAGLVDFDPDLRDAVLTNVIGTRNVADFLEGCDHAKLLHISTCYVTGTRNGTIEETLLPNFSPDGEPFDVDQELAEVEEVVAAVIEKNQSPKQMERHRKKALKKIRERNLDPDNQTLVRTMTRRAQRDALKDAMIKAGQQRSYAHGWPNIYTYTKSLAESVLIKRCDRIAFSVLRPAIVESALTYPFQGWNQGFNTCGPLSYLLGSWFRHLPVRNGNPFDIIPVDYVCRAMAIAGAELLLDISVPVYQCGSSDINQLTIDRACDLVALAHRRHLRERGKSTMERVLLSRWDAVPSDPVHLLSVENIRKAAKGLSRAMRKVPRKWPKGIREQTDKWAEKAEDVKDKLNTIDRLLTLYLPFIHDNYFVFECAALRRNTVEEAAFVFDTTAIDWRHYWLEVHVPGLRKWCFPLFEGKTPEQYEPQHPFQLPPQTLPEQVAPPNRPPRSHMRPAAAEL